MTMRDEVDDLGGATRDRETALRLGVWVAVLTAASAAIALVLGALTPPRGGSFCRGSCISITYPYTDAASFVPRDYLWMYPAFLMATLFVVLVACVHRRAPAGRKVLGSVASAFAVIAATALTADYFIQLAVMQPSLLKGEAGGLSAFSAYNPQGVFVALEDLGYLMMGIAFAFVAGTLGRGERLERTTRLTLFTASALAVGSLVVLAALYRSDLGYRYEVVVIVVDWLALIASGVMLSVLFRRDLAP